MHTSACSEMPLWCVMTQVVIDDVFHLKYLIYLRIVSRIKALHLMCISGVSCNEDMDK